MKMRPEALIFGYKNIENWTVMNRLEEIQTPTLVLAGRYDFLFPPEHQAILADRIPNARLELVECAGHNPQIEQTEVTIEAIRRFLLS
jgi:proline iminopeptidase